MQPVQNGSILFQGGGEMGRRIREYDWAATSLGSPENWPASLRNSINIILSSRFPMFIWWGPDLIQFYNDAYRPSLGDTGKHPSALGQRGEECWPEIWPVIYPLIRQVLDGGESTWSEDQLIPIYRNGRLEDVYWTFGYSPIIDELGVIRGVLVVCSENTGKILAYQRLKESEDQLSFAIESTELGTWDYNPKTEKFKANSRLKSWFGLQAGEEIDLAIAVQCMIPGDRGRVQAAIEEALRYESGGQYDIRYTIVSKLDGKERIVRAKGRAWFNEEHIAYRFNGTLQDVTEQELAHGRLTELVAERTAELQRSNEDLMQFAHVISHDLKEPVRKVRIYGKRIIDEMGEQLPTAGHVYLEKMQNAAGRMFSMIEGVLNYSSLSSAQAPMQPIDLNEVLQNVRMDLEVVIQQKGARVESVSLPAVFGIRVLIHQLFYNLINNSLKFARPGVEPVISVSVDDIGAEVRPGFATIVIADNGIGFDPANAGRIFETFTRLNSKDQYEGTGLGLALGKKIVQRHGGQIHATGTKDGGASFHFSLPLAPASYA